MWSFVSGFFARLENAVTESLCSYNSRLTEHSHRAFLTRMQLQSTHCHVSSTLLPPITHLKMGTWGLNHAPAVTCFV